MLKRFAREALLELHHRTDVALPEVPRPLLDVFEGTKAGLKADAATLDKDNVSWRHTLLIQQG